MKFRNYHKYVYISYHQTMSSVEFVKQASISALFSVTCILRWFFSSQYILLLLLAVHAIFELIDGVSVLNICSSLTN